MTFSHGAVYNDLRSAELPIAIRHSEMSIPDMHIICKVICSYLKGGLLSIC